MGWGRLDDGYADHPKTLQLSLEAVAVDVLTVTWANKHETDGFLPRSVAVHLARGDRTDLFSELVNLRRWTTTETGYMIHGFLEWNQSKKTKVRERKQAASRMRALRKRSHEVRPNMSRSSAEVREQSRVEEKRVEKSRGERCRTTVPDGPLDDAYRRTALDAGIGPDDLDSLWREFQDYWRGVPGAKGRKGDWPATWRNRCVEMAPRLGRRSTGNGRPAPASPSIERQRKNLAMLKGMVTPGG